MMRACGADDDVLCLIIRQKFKKLRFQMLDDKKSPSLRTIVNLATVLEQKPSEMLKEYGAAFEC
jgi:hypothetical protein